MNLDISVETLYKKSNVKVVNDQIKELWLSVKHKIYDAHNKGLAETDFSLPDTFICNSLEPADVQLIIYSSIIEQLQQAGHRVVLTKTVQSSGSSDSILHISWPSVLDAKEKDRMKKIILSAVVKK